MKNKNKKKKKKFKKPFVLERTKSYNTICDQIERIAPLVYKILQKDLKSRDDDNFLLIKVWKRQGLKEKVSFKKFKYQLIMGKLALPETIMRARRLIQSRPENAHVRGELYAERHKAEEEVINQLRFF